MYVYNGSVHAVNQWGMSTGIYCLTNKTGRPTQLEKIVEDLLEEVNGNIACKKCKGQLLHGESRSMSTKATDRQ